MKKPNNFLEWLKNPRGVWLVVLYFLTICAAAGAIVISILGMFEFPLDIIAYVIYGIAAVLLGYSVYTIVKVIPTAKERIKTWMKKYKFTRMLLEEFDFRTLIFTIGSFLISFAYVVFNGAIGILGGSIWYIALATYYLLLALMRGGILLYHYKKKKRDDFGSEKERLLEIKSYRSCGITLIFMPICLSVAIAQMVTGENTFHHYGFTLYVAAIYAFYKIIMSIVNIFRAQKNDDYTIRAARSVNLSDAFVSILALQTAMLADLPTEGVNIGLYNALAGGVVCFLTVALGVYIIVMSQLVIKKIKISTNEDITE